MAEGNPNIKLMKKEGDISGLVECLDNSSDNVRYRAFSALASGPRLDYRTTVRLKKMLHDPDPKVRTVAALKFSDLRSRITGDYLKEIISRGSQIEKIELLRIISGCSRLSDEAVMEVIVLALADHRDLVRLEAAKTAGTTQNPHLVPPLAERLSDEDPYVRIQAAKSLSKIAGRETVAHLVGLLEDPNGVVREEVYRILSSVDSDVARRAVHDYLLRKMAQGMEGTAPARARTAVDIRTRRLRECLPLLHAACSDRFKGVRIEALKGIAVFGDPSSVEFVVVMLKDKFFDVRIEAVRTLGNIKSESSLQAIEAACEDKNIDVREEALVIVAQLRAAVRRTKQKA